MREKKEAKLCKTGEIFPREALCNESVFFG